MGVVIEAHMRIIMHARCMRAMRRHLRNCAAFTGAHVDLHDMYRLCHLHARD